MNYLERKEGQFIPISAMVMFTIVVFMVTAVNVYKISRTKLKLQNLADAAALNLAAQHAQAYNIVADRNEWLNRMTAGIPSPSDPNAPANVRDCSVFANPRLIPPIACVENNFPVNSRQVNTRKVWNARGDPRTAKDGAIGYAMLIYTINTGQKLFLKAYNSFIGDQSAGTGSASSTSGPSNFEGLLKADIPELANDSGIRLVAWNSGDPGMEEMKDIAANSSGRFNSTRMRGLKFKVHHDIATRYKTNRGIEATTLGKLLFGRINYGDNNKKNGPLYGQPFEDVGWLVPDTANQPTIQIRKSGTGGSTNQVGVGVYVSKDLSVPVVGKVTVAARSKAYVVSSSGQVGDNSGVPVFKPTYWVKLAN